MKELFCKRVHSSIPGGVTVQSLLLQKNGSSIAAELIQVTADLRVGQQTVLEKDICGQKIRFEVWKSPDTQVLGGIAGPSCVAHIADGNHRTTLHFVFPEKNTTGHNSADLRLPLF